MPNAKTLSPHDLALLRPDVQEGLADILARTERLWREDDAGLRHGAQSDAFDATIERGIKQVSGRAR